MRNPIMQTCVSLAGVALLLVGWAPSAAADIIVVNGKIGSDPSHVDGPRSCPTFGEPTGGDPLPNCSPVPGTPEGDVAGGDTDSGGELSDLDKPPAGWTCKSIGAGIEVCEPPPSKEDGVQGPAATGPTNDDPVVGLPGDGFGGDAHAAGCAGGGDPASGLVPALLLLALLALWAARRRVA